MQNFRDSGTLTLIWLITYSSRLTSIGIKSILCWSRGMSNPRFWRDDRRYGLQSTPMSFEVGTGIWIPLQLLETSICRTRIAQQNTIPCCFALVCLSQSQIQREFTCFHSFVILLGFCVCQWGWSSWLLLGCMALG